MSRYPREVRDALLKCIGCNAPVARTVDGRFVCVACGDSPIEADRPSVSNREGEAGRATVSIGDAIGDEGGTMTDDGDSWSDRTTATTGRSGPAWRRCSDG